MSASCKNWKTVITSYGTNLILSYMDDCLPNSCGHTMQSIKDIRFALRSDTCDELLHHSNDGLTEYLLSILFHGFSPCSSNSKSFNEQPPAAENSHESFKSDYSSEPVLPSVGY